MKVKLFLALWVLVFIVAPISAIDTPITIKTIPNYDLQIAFLVPGTTYSLLGDGLVQKSSDTTGKATLVFSTSREDFEIKIWLKKDGENILIKRFEEVYDAGVPLTLELYPAWYTPKTETPETNETNETTQTESTSVQEESQETLELENPEEESTPIEKVKAEKERVTAFSIQEGKVTITTKGFLYILGLIILGVLIFLGIKHSHHIEKKVKSLKGEDKKEIKIKKMSDLNQKKSSKIEEQEEKIEKAKQMIEEAQAEIQKMKNPNQSKIDEIKKRLIEDEKELMKLRRESGEIN